MTIPLLKGADPQTVLTCQGRTILQSNYNNLYSYLCQTEVLPFSPTCHIVTLKFTPSYKVFYI